MTHPDPATPAAEATAANGPDADPFAGTQRTVWTYRHRFALGSVAGLVTFISGLRWTEARLTLDGVDHDIVRHPMNSAATVEPFALTARLADGRTVDAVVGYIDWLRTGLQVRVDGALVHESHRGRAIAPPERVRAMMRKFEAEQAAEAQAGTAGGANPAIDLSRLSANKLPIAVDIGTGLLFFVVAKLTDLTTAAVVGAGVGLALAAAQKIWRVDLLGGLAAFGIVLMLLSAAFSLAFDDPSLVQQKSTILGVLAGALFLGDAALLHGRRLGAGFNRYLAYTDVDVRRLAAGMGLSALAMAGLNWAVVRLATEDQWLTYTTFIDVPISMGFALLAIRWARRGATNSG